VEVPVSPGRRDGQGDGSGAHDDRPQDATDDRDHQEVPHRDGSKPEGRGGHPGDHAQEEGGRKGEDRRREYVLWQEVLASARNREKTGVDPSPEARPQGTEDVPSHADGRRDQYDQAGEQLQSIGHRRERQAREEVPSGRDEEGDEALAQGALLRAPVIPDPFGPAARTIDERHNGTLTRIVLLGEWAVARASMHSSGWPRQAS